MSESGNEQGPGGQDKKPAHLVKYGTLNADGTIKQEDVFYLPADAAPGEVYRKLEEKGYKPKKDEFAESVWNLDNYVEPAQDILAKSDGTENDLPISKIDTEKVSSPDEK